MDAHPARRRGAPGCEWNLDHFPPDEHANWIWNRITRAQQRAGFTSDRLLARATDAEPVGRNGFRFLVALSAAIVALTLTAIAAALWLIVAGGPFWPIVFGLALLGLAWAIRPRFNRLKPMLKTSYRVEPANAPAFHALIDRIAAELGTPKPDVVLFTFGWNAGVTVTGPRPRRVLVVGVQLLLALRAEEVVALLGHELGHLAYADNRRLLLTMPARLTFGRLSELVRPPRVSALEVGPSVQLIWLTLWQLTGGVQRHVPKGEAAATWRRMLRSVQDREAELAPARRQLSIRTAASLFASHPAAGRRYEWLNARPHHEAAVVVSDPEALEREIAPYAEALHRTMLKEIVHD
ncbi:M48 family metalloprotease [Actinoplanes sp. NPDC000266]